MRHRTVTKWSASLAEALVIPERLFVNACLTLVEPVVTEYAQTLPPIPLFKVYPRWWGGGWRGGGGRAGAGARTPEARSAARSRSVWRCGTSTASERRWDEAADPSLNVVA